jgi:hypothetical protein
VRLEGHPTHGSIHLFGDRLHWMFLSKRLEVSDVLGTPALRHNFIAPYSRGLNREKAGSSFKRFHRAYLAVMMPTDSAGPE